MPRLVEAAKRYEGRVEFLGVDVQDVTEEAQKFIDEQGIPFPNLADEGGKIKLAQGVLGLPSTEFYRADGELAGIHRGEISAEELERRIEELLAVGVPATPPG
jgi:peroxiredoxin